MSKERDSTTRRKSRPKGGRAGAPSARTRSFPCPDELWAEVEAFAREHELGAPAAAARLLLRKGLAVERRSRELEASRDWQIEQAWSEVEAIAAGDRSFGSWEEIEQAADQARRRIRQRAAAQSSRTSRSR